MSSDVSKMTFMIAALIGALALFVAGFIIALAVQSTSASPVQEQKTYGPGWVNIAHLGPTQPVADALSGIQGNVGIIYYLDPTTGGWWRNIPDRPEANNFNTMTFGQSYLMLLTAPTTMTVPTEGTFPTSPASCPTGTPCPASTPCPACPSASTELADLCTGYEISIEVDEVMLEIAEAGLLVGRTASEVRTSIEQTENVSGALCPGVTLLDPSPRTGVCALAGKWEGIETQDILYAPSAQKQVWASTFHNIVDKYCLAD